MGKRSDFERIEKDFYKTIDPRAGEMLSRVFDFNDIDSVFYYEPCCGGGDLIKNITQANEDFTCIGKSDISTGKDALTLTPEDVAEADYIITNPPWSRPILHDMIMHFKNLKPTFLLFDADWAMNKSAVPYLEYCHAIYPIGRLRWIEGTNMQSKDNCAWYLFDKDMSTQTLFKNLRN